MKAGEVLFLSGRVITLRDKAMKRVIQEGPPVDFSEAYVFIAGPIVRNGEVVSCGPTTATRMEDIIYDFIRITRPRMIIGKGPMYENMERAARDFGVPYAVFPGGCGALAAKRLRVVKNIRPELGMPESIRVFEARDFGPVMVVIDGKENLMRGVEEKARRTFERMRF